MCSKAARVWSTQSQVGAIVSAVADLVGYGEYCRMGRVWFVVCVGARICMLLRTMEPGPRAPSFRALATEAAPLNAGVYRGPAFELVVAGCEEARNTRRAASKVPLGFGSVGVVERVDWKRSRLAVQTEFSCCPCYALPGATAQSSFRSSQAPLLGFIAVCSQSAFANRFANMVSPAGNGVVLHRDAMPWCRVSWSSEVMRTEHVWSYGGPCGRL